jgi:methionine-rich copper-binding protein CopC
MEFMMRLLPISALALALAGIASPAMAHPKLLAATPAANTTVAPTNRIELRFSEKLIAQFAGASLDMTDMPGMRMHAPMTMKVATSVTPDGLGLNVVTAKPLPKGTYKITYHVVSADTHRIEGTYSFNIQ